MIPFQERQSPSRRPAVVGGPLVFDPWVPVGRHVGRPEGLAPTNLGEVTPRRQQILDIAADLFAERGFHGVSVADLGAACGMTGPALYKHFASKDAVLAEMLISISEELLAQGRARAAQAADPGAALIALIDGHVEFALSHPSLIVVQDRDWSSLPAEAREQVRQLQRDYVDLWADQIRAHNPALRPDTARAAAHVAFGLVNSTPHSALLPNADMHHLLREMAIRALGLRSA